MLLGIVCFTLFATAIASGFIYWQKHKTTPTKYTGPIETVRLSTYLGEYAGLIWIAQNKGYFAENGLDVNIKEFQTGIEAMDSLVAGEADLSTQAEAVVVANIVEDEDFKIIAEINSTYGLKLIANRSSSISKAADLKGKRIAVTQKSPAEYFLSTFLIFNNVDNSEVEITYLKPAEIIPAFEAGQIDAVMIWQPLAYQIEGKLGQNSISWEGQTNTPFRFLLTGTNELINERPQVPERFLKALVQAQNVPPAEARQILKNRLKYEEKYMEVIWPNLDFHVTLDQKLLPLMEDEARFAIENNTTQLKEIPDYLNYIYVDALKIIKPEAVTIIGK